MKKTKRLVSFVTATALMFSIAAPALAATVNEAYGRLNALGVAKGYTDGTIGADKNITRAEFAAVAVRLLGMEAAVNSAKGGTKFNDVTYSHWASGYINLAVGSGIIKGYPGGSFKPEANVTYAEASAMLVRVLGYEPQITGVWPTNYIGKAAQLGLLDGVNTTDFNSAAIRGNVFLAADNSLDVVVLKSTKDGYEEDTKTLMEKKLSVTIKKEATVTQVPLTSGTKNKVTLDYTQGGILAVTPASETLDVLATIDPNTALGLKVEAWVKDDKVFFFNVKTSASDIVTDSVKSINGVEKNPGATAQAIVAGTKFKVSKADKEYTVATAPTLYKNYATTGALLSVDDAVKVILDANGKAKTIIATSYTRGLVDTTDVANEKINFKGDGAPGGAITLKDKTATILKDGKGITIADIKAGDMVDYYNNGDNYYIIVTSKSVTGKLTTVAENGTNANNATKFKVTVGGTEYALTGAAGGSFYSTDSGKNYDAVTSTSDLGSLLNQDVKAILNKDGKIAYLTTSEASASNEIVALVKYTQVVNLGELTRNIYVAKADGTNTYYEVTKDTKIDNVKINEVILKTAAAGAQFQIATGTDIAITKAVVRGEVVKLTLTADGKKIDNIKTYNMNDDVLNEILTPGIVGTAGSFVQQTPGISIDKNADSINVAGTGSLAVNSDTKIFKVKSLAAGSGFIDDVEMTTWSSVEALSDANKVLVNAVVVKDGGVAKVIVIYNTNAALNLASDYKYGALVEKGYDGSDYLKLNLGSATETLKNKGTVGATVYIEDLVRYKIASNGDFDSVTAVAAQTTGSATYNYFKIKKVNTNNKQLEVVYSDVDGNEQPSGSTYYMFYDTTKTKVFDVTGTNSVAYVADINTTVNTTVKLYNAYDKDEKDLANGGDAADQVIDYISIVKK